MTISEFNNLDKVQAFTQLFKCCGSTNWAKNLVEKIPFQNIESLKEISNQIWNLCDEKDFLEAFTHHPKIGDVKSLELKFTSTKTWAAGEQASVGQASFETINLLAEKNQEYENKFGFIFIVCATGKTAEQMLELLIQRLPNTIEKEIAIAATEQNKITHIRIDKLFI